LKTHRCHLHHRHEVPPAPDHMQSKGTQALKQKTIVRSKSQKEQKSSKAKQLLQQPSKGKLKSISTAMISVNLKFEKEKWMLNANELCKAGRFCVELYNYYILNWKRIDVIVVKYRQSHFLTNNGVFIISLSNLYDMFNLDVLDVSLMRCFVL
jgi:hypothetical protein